MTDNTRVPKKNHPCRWREVRIFLSSTFRDFHAERDYLVKIIFPELRQWCLKYKLHLVDIDLRWGVTRQEAESGKVVNICLNQIDGSRPFFICMLGDRYGWIPEASDIAESTIDQYPQLDKHRTCSVTHMEIRHAVLAPMHSHKEAEPTQHAFFYFREPKNLLPDSSDPALFKDFDKNQLKVLHHTFFEQTDSGRLAVLDLKAEVRSHYAGLANETQDPQLPTRRIFEYAPVFDPSLLNAEDDQLKGRFTADSLKPFGTRVLSDLKQAVRKQFQDRFREMESAGSEPADVPEMETDLHDSFMADRTRLFSGRGQLVEAIFDYLSSDSDQILAVFGDPGSGKSSLLAHAARLMTDQDYRVQYPENSCIRQVAQEADFVMTHFIGAGPLSMSLHDMLTRICHGIRAHFQLEDEVPVQAMQLIRAFPKFLAQCPRKTIILIDALNQLEAEHLAHDLYWLPTVLPTHVKIIASTLEGPSKEALQTKTDRHLTVGPLSLDERRRMIADIPSIYCKTLEEQHIDIILEKAETQNPLYLKVALDLLRMTGSFEKLPQEVASLPDTVVGLFMALFRRQMADIDNLYGHTRSSDSQTMGMFLVERFYCLLECSRFGLTQQEIRDLMLPHDPKYSYAVILRQIRDYIYRRGPLIDFFHGQLSKAVTRMFFNENEAAENSN